MGLIFFSSSRHATISTHLEHLVKKKWHSKGNSSDPLLPGARCLRNISFFLAAICVPSVFVAGGQVFIFVPGPNLTWRNQGANGQHPIKLMGVFLRASNYSPSVLWTSEARVGADGRGKCYKIFGAHKQPQLRLGESQPWVGCSCGNLERALQSFKSPY